MSFQHLKTFYFTHPTNVSNILACFISSRNTKGEDKIRPQGWVNTFCHSALTFLKQLLSNRRDFDFDVQHPPPWVDRSKWGQTWEWHGSSLPLTLSTSGINCVLNSNKILLGLVPVLAHCDYIYDTWSAAACRFWNSREVIHLCIDRSLEKASFFYFFPLTWAEWPNSDQWKQPAEQSRVECWVCGRWRKCHIRTVFTLMVSLATGAALRVLWFWKFKM